MIKKQVFILIALFIGITSKAMIYTVSFDKVKSHYVTVEMQFSSNGKDYIDFHVPVWTPGSYKVREFSNAFENVTADGREIIRVDKNTWRVDTKGIDNVKLSYDVYCFTVSVRQSYADEYYAFLHGVSAFGYVEGLEEEAITLIVEPFTGWNDVEVALPQNKAQGFVFNCTNYDLLADSPIACGNFEKINYTSGKVPHKVVMIGEGNYDLEKINADFKAISDSQIKMMGDHPSKQYTHFVYNVSSGGGGLEHLNSQTSMMRRWSYTDESAYKRFLGLIAHEYFHLWNVKRVRPIQLGPFNYNEEVYTDMLWIAEGITSYYDDLTLYRIGKYELKDYLGIISGQINRLENTPGKEVMSLAHSSMLAWVKAYLPNEESVNKTISYYNKGMLAALMLDLEIRSESNKCLDDVMTTLYNDYYKNKDRGFTHDEFISVCSNLANRDMRWYFDDVIFSTKPLDYNTLFAKYGIVAKDQNEASPSPWTGVKSKMDGGKNILTTVYANSPALDAGLSVNDEVISINNWRVNKEIEKYDEIHKTGEEVEILYSRDSKLLTSKLTYVNSPFVKYDLEVTDKENKLLKKWLNL